jgi:glycosyltransferase involved in cell wall biosynthesis
MKIGFNIDALVCPLGVDSNCFRPLTGIVKENVIISVGELSPRKGFDFLIESLANIPSGQRPQLRLACNSVDPDERDYIQNLADQNEIELQVLTNLNTEELVLQYNLAKICVYAPIKEPFGLVPLEAMACGTPVVGVQEGGVGEIILNNRTGLLVERDPVLFARAVLSLLAEPEKCAHFGQQAREYSKNGWGWEKSTATLEGFLTSISGG